MFCDNCRSRFQPLVLRLSNVECASIPSSWVLTSDGLFGRWGFCFITSLNCLACGKGIWMATTRISKFLCFFWRNLSQSWSFTINYCILRFELVRVLMVTFVHGWTAELSVQVLCWCISHTGGLSPGTFWCKNYLIMLILWLLYFLYLQMYSL